MNLLSAKHNHQALHRATLTMASILAIGLIGIIPSCSKKDTSFDWEGGPIPMEVKISVADENGNNILDPSESESISSNTITARFKGMTYERDKKAVKGISLSTLQDAQSVPSVLLFGQIEGKVTLEDETLTLDWGDGTTSTITLSNFYVLEDGDVPKLERHIIYDGKDWMDKPSVVITKRSK